MQPTKGGGRCITPLRPGETFCYSHDPARAEQRKKDAASKRHPGDLGTELGTLDGIARRVAKVLEDLDTFAEVEDPETGQVLEYIPILTPARASAKLNALRALAALVIRRTERKRLTVGDTVPGEDQDLDAALG